jgi:hypothetical protein
MFNRKKEPSELDKIITKVETEMSAVPSDSEDFAAMTARLAELNTIRNAPKQTRGPSADTLAVVTGNVLVTAVIVGYERTNVVTSKARTFIQQLR